MKKEAIDTLKGLYTDACSEGLYKDLSSCSTKELIKMYKKHPKHSLERDIPNVGFWLDNFRTEYLDRHGILINKTFKGESLEWGVDTPHEGYYILNRCSGVLNFKSYEVVRLYVSNGCDLEINVSGNADVYISAFGYSKIKVTNDKDSNCRVALHQNVTCIKKGFIKGLVQKNYEQ